MAAQFTRPTPEQVHETLQRHAPHLADAPIEFLAEGWEFWAFTAGDFVLRFPKGEGGYVWKLGDRSSAESLRIEEALTHALTGRLSTPVSVTQVYSPGPNGAPFAGHRWIAGEAVFSASRRPDENFGHDLGLLLRQLHSFPAQPAIDLGVPLFDGKKLLEDRSQHYEAVIRRAFPLISCEARAHIESVYEAYLNEPRNFAFEPRLVHCDLAMNVLIDPASGRLSGVIDFGDAAVTSPAIDYWLPQFGFKQLDIEDQLGTCLDSAGMDAAGLHAMVPELAFLDLRYPLLGVLHGLNIEDESFVEESIRELNVLLPRDLRC
jgi:aminoglycoside 2''-phosphotransferase